MRVKKTPWKRPREKDGAFLSPLRHSTEIAEVSQMSPKVQYNLEQKDRAIMERVIHIQSDSHVPVNSFATS